MIAGINRKDRIRSLTSFASKPAGMLQRIKDLGGNTDVEIRTGDVVITQLETENGILLSLTHDTTLPVRAVWTSRYKARKESGRETDGLYI